MMEERNMAERISFFACEPSRDRSANLARLRALESRIAAEGVKPGIDLANRRTQWDFANGDRYIYTWGETIRTFRTRRLDGR